MRLPAFAWRGMSEMYDSKVIVERRWTIEELRWTKHQLVIRHRWMDQTFSSTYWYPDVDLLALDRRYGHAVMERIHLHTALFEGAKFTSLRPTVIDLGPYAKYHTEAMEQLFRKIHHGVWAQWRYEHNLPHEPLAPFASTAVFADNVAIQRDRQSAEVLVFCGGGKDSLVAMKLLERSQIVFATLGYAASCYGASEPQFALLDKLLDHSSSTMRHRQVVLDDFTDAPVLALEGAALGVKSITAAETPSSVFAALPIALDRGYRWMVLGNEASANRGNLQWNITGEEINHQWGKSVEAEALLDEYLRTQLVSDVGMFSVLMPLHDVLIFALARRDESAVRSTHSCNLRKPWCKRCAKCAYVWLGMRAHLSRETVEDIFGEDLLEVAENAEHFYALCGLREHTPFECVGRIEESRLALALCGARELLGPRGRALLEQIQPIQSIEDVSEELLTVQLGQSRIPAEFAGLIATQMNEAQSEARSRIAQVLARAKER